MYEIHSSLQWKSVFRGKMTALHHPLHPVSSETSTPSLIQYQWFLNRDGSGQRDPPSLPGWYLTMAVHPRLPPGPGQASRPTFAPRTPVSKSTLTTPYHRKKKLTTCVFSLGFVPRLVILCVCVCVRVQWNERPMKSMEFAFTPKAGEKRTDGVP